MQEQTQTKQLYNNMIDININITPTYTILYS
jgi:hypothetical protein